MVCDYALHFMVSNALMITMPVVRSVRPPAVLVPFNSKFKVGSINVLAYNFKLIRVVLQVVAFVCVCTSTSSLPVINSILSTASALAVALVVLLLSDSDSTQSCLE